MKTHAASVVLVPAVVLQTITSIHQQMYGATENNWAPAVTMCWQVMFSVLLYCKGDQLGTTTDLM